jgi:hypothetical protein
MQIISAVLACVFYFSTFISIPILAINKYIFKDDTFKQPDFKTVVLTLSSLFIAILFSVLVYF